MPVELKVGPPVLTINQGSTFMVTDQGGEIDSNSEHGVFSRYPVRQLLQALHRRRTVGVALLRRAQLLRSPDPACQPGSED